MVDIRQSSASADKVAFDADSVAGDLWMRQNYHEIHVELEKQDVNAFLEKARAAGLLLDNAEVGGLQSDTDLAH